MCDGRIVLAEMKQKCCEKTRQEEEEEQQGTEGEVKRREKRKKLCNRPTILVARANPLSI